MSSAPPPYGDKGYNYNHPQGPTMAQPVFTGSPIFIPGEYPVQCVCPQCRNTIVTRTQKENGLLTWLLVGGLFLIGCWLGCCFIPLCVDACKDTVHYCPNCAQLLGIKKQLS